MGLRVVGQIITNILPSPTDLPPDDHPDESQDRK
jgi:hypothetical protein